MAWPTHQVSRGGHQEVMVVTLQGGGVIRMARAVGANVDELDAVDAVAIVEGVVRRSARLEIGERGTAEHWSGPQGQGEVAPAGAGEPMEPTQGCPRPQHRLVELGAAGGHQAPEGVDVEEDVGGKSHPSIRREGVAVVNIHHPETQGFGGLLLPLAQGASAKEEVGGGLVQREAGRIEGRGVEPDGGTRHRRRRSTLGGVSKDNGALGPEPERSRASARPAPEHERRTSGARAERESPAVSGATSAPACPPCRVRHGFAARTGPLDVDTGRTTGVGWGAQGLGVITSSGF